MTSLTKNPHPQPKFFFHRKLEDFPSLLNLWTALYRFWHQSYARTKPHAIQLFWRKNALSLADAKELLNQGVNN